MRGHHSVSMGRGKARSCVVSNNLQRAFTRKVAFSHDDIVSSKETSEERWDNGGRCRGWRDHEEIESGDRLEDVLSSLIN